MTTAIQRQILDGSVERKIDEAAYTDQIKPIWEGIEVTNVEFDPDKHLAFDPSYAKTVKRTTMEEVGFNYPDQISDIGVSAPFPLFTEEACDIMKAEVLREDVFKNWARVSNSSTSGLDAIIRGYAKDTCPFTFAAWTHPKTVAAVSAMAGVELEVIMDYEVAHVNVAMKSKNEADNEKEDLRRKASMADSFDDNIPAVVGWHNDSYPFVCVLMLSDTEGMIGGETLIRTGSSEIIKAAGPAKGKATVLQGRKLVHLAPKPLGFTERITAVTSYRAKDSMKPEGSVLSTVKPEVQYGSLYNQFYPEWVDYRMNVIKDRADYIQKTFNTAKETGKDFDKEKATELLKDLEAYTRKTWTEMQVSDDEWQQYQKNFQ